jgi:hypothetical protein
MPAESIDDPLLTIWRGKDLDELITPATACAELPRRRRGARVAIPTLYRWMNGGCRGVRLRYAQIGGTRCVSRRWLSEFFAALAVQAGRVPAPPAPATPAVRSRTASAREKADAKAARDLDQHKI